MSFAKEFLTYRKTRSTAVTIIGWVDDDDKLIDKIDWVCCAVLDIYSHSDILKKTYKNVKWVLVSHQDIRDNITKEESLAWIDYLVNRSPYSSAFVVKDPEQIYGKFYTLDANVDSSFLAGASIMARFDTEESLMIDQSFQMYQEFLRWTSETKAYLLAQMFYIPLGGSTLNYCGEVGHTVISPYRWKKTTFNHFLNYTPSPPVNPYRDTLSYRYIDRYWHLNVGVGTSEDEFKNYLTKTNFEKNNGSLDIFQQITPRLMMNISIDRIGNLTKAFDEWLENE